MPLALERAGTWLGRAGMRLERPLATGQLLGRGVRNGAGQSASAARNESRSQRPNGANAGRGWAMKRFPYIRVSD